MLLCGMQEIDITPPIGKRIPGQFKEKVSTGVLDPLYAKSAVLDNGRQIFVFLSVDNCGLTDPYVTRIKDLIHRTTGIDRKNMLVASTHTHTGGPTLMWPGYYEDTDEEYLDFVVHRAAEAASSALESRRPARIGAGRGSESRISFNRRYRMRDGTMRTNPGVSNPDVLGPAGPIDPDVVVMRIDGLDGSPIGVITNFACHMDCVGGTKFSADYGGELSRQLKKALGENVVSLFLTGACGNINHINYMTAQPIRPEHWKWMGRLLSEDVLAVREGLPMTDSLDIGVEMDSLSVKRRLPSEQEIEFMKETLPRSEDELSALDWWRAKQAELILRDPDWNRPVEFPVQSVRLGNSLIAAIPGEAFVEYALEIKQKCGFPLVMVSTLSNNMIGYIPTSAALKESGYEATVAYSSFVQPDTGKQIVDTILKQAERLRAK